MIEKKKKRSLMDIYNALSQGHKTTFSERNLVNMDKKKIRNKNIKIHIDKILK